MVKIRKKIRAREGLSAGLEESVKTSISLPTLTPVHNGLSQLAVYVKIDGVSVDSDHVNTVSVRPARSWTFVSF